MGYVINLASGRLHEIAPAMALSEFGFGKFLRLDVGANHSRNTHMHPWQTQVHHGPELAQCVPYFYDCSDVTWPFRISDAFWDLSPPARDSLFFASSNTRLLLSPWYFFFASSPL